MLRTRFAVAALALLCAGSIYGYAFDDTRGYFGGEISIFNLTHYNAGNTPDLNAFKTSNGENKLAIQKNKAGFNIFAGFRFTDFVGLELGFGLVQKAKASVQNGREAYNEVSTLYLDGMGYLPVSETVDLIGSIGVGRLKSRPSVTNYTFVDEDSLDSSNVSYRLGVGAQYLYNLNWAFRAMLRYQRGDKSFLQGNTSFSIGVLYMFA